MISAMSAARRSERPATSKPWFTSSTAQLARIASRTASASASVPGMMKGTRGSSPKNAASVEIGRNGRPEFARIVAWGAWA
jgi:hypothetical protein